VDQQVSTEQMILYSLSV